MKPVALYTDYISGYIDHIAPLCALWKTPYLFTDSVPYDYVVANYPAIDAHLVDPMDCVLEKLEETYDSLLVSVCHAPDPSLRLKTILVPHGNSDKGHSHSMQALAHLDIVLLYGRRMLDFLVDKAVKMRAYWFMGNWRYYYYLIHKEFYRPIIEQKFGPKKGKKRILYAPTWAGTLAVNEKILQDLPSDYQLIVKIHPYDQEHHLGQLQRLMGRYEDKENIQFLLDFPLIYPLLETVDIYIGDYSSIGYDFLVFNRPLFFTALSPFLGHCGTMLTDPVYQTIEKTLRYDHEHFSLMRKKIYRYTFHPTPADGGFLRFL